MTKYVIWCAVNDDEFQPYSPRLVFDTHEKAHECVQDMFAMQCQHWADGLDLDDVYHYEIRDEHGKEIDI